VSQRLFFSQLCVWPLNLYGAGLLKKLFGNCWENQKKILFEKVSAKPPIFADPHESIHENPQLKAFLYKKGPTMGLLCFRHGPPAILHGVEKLTRGG
jgi:hypothetical protein